MCTRISKDLSSDSGLTFYDSLIGIWLLWYFALYYFCYKNREIGEHTMPTRGPE